MSCAFVYDTGNVNKIVIVSSTKPPSYPYAQVSTGLKLYLGWCAVNILSQTAMLQTNPNRSYGRECKAPVVYFQYSHCTNRLSCSSYVLSSTIIPNYTPQKAETLVIHSLDTADNAV